MKRTPGSGALLGALLTLLLAADAPSQEAVTDLTRNTRGRIPVPAPEGVALHDSDPVPDGWLCDGTGGLHVVVDGEIRRLEFPLEHTKVDADVSGPVARVEVTQTFQNPYDETIEAIYVFPLPHDAAVNDLEMRLGERVIHGIIERRAEARRIYEHARDTGRVAALLEQERPNIFTQSVANILPGNEIEIRLTYVETLDYDEGSYELMFPMVVGPRFIPPGGSVVPAGGFAPVPAPGADRINPAFLPPAIRSGHDIEVNVTLDAGLPVRDLRSPTHVVHAETKKTTAFVTLNPLDTIPNKDFVLRWRVEGDAPEAGVLAYHDGEQGYVTLMIHPKLHPAERDITAKEMIFVLDCSGSMSGEPMAAAKALVRHSLRNMRADDTFQIIRFSTNASGFAPRPVAASAGNVKRGIAYVDRLNGGGGTMMIEGIRAALDFPEDPGRLRIVMFLTDGYIGNENEIMAAVRDRIGSARLFSLGVGSSVNRFLLDGMAEEGRGEVQYFLPGSDAQTEVARFYDRIRNPFLTDIEVSWDGVDVRDRFPQRVPDLFEGRPLVIHARYDDARRGEVRVHGKIAGRTWEKRIRLDLPQGESGNPAIGTLWARACIGDLEKRMVRGETPELVRQVTEIGLRHRLVTKYTSFVAVEERMIVSDGRPKAVRVPVDMPEGVSFEGVFGGKGETAAEDTRLTQAFRGSGRANAAKMPGSMGTGGFLAVSPSSGDVPVTLDEKLSIGGERDRLQAEPHRKLLPGKERRELLLKSDGDARPMAMTAVRIRLAGAQTSWRMGDKIVLTLDVRNGSRYDVDLPTALLEGRLLPTFRVIDSRWNESMVTARLTAGGAVRKLAAGATETVTIVLDTKDVRFFHGPGIYHLTVLGSPFLSLDSNRFTVRIDAL